MYVHMQTYTHGKEKHENKLAGLERLGIVAESLGSCLEGPANLPIFLLSLKPTQGKETPIPSLPVVLRPSLTQKLKFEFFFKSIFFFLHIILT